MSLPNTSLSNTHRRLRRHSSWGRVVRGFSPRQSQRVVCQRFSRRSGDYVWGSRTSLVAFPPRQWR
jgi:hypothetical protein